MLPMTWSTRHGYATPSTALLIHIGSLGYNKVSNQLLKKLCLRFRAQIMDIDYILAFVFYYKDPS